MTNEDDTVPPGTLERVDLILEVLAENGTATLSEIAAFTALPVSSTHRLLERLVELRWLSRNGRGYELGVRVFELGSTVVRSHWFHRGSLPILRELHARTGLVVHLGFLDGAETVYWERIAGSAGARVPTRIGGRLPAYRSAVGKCLLSALADDDLDDGAYGPADESDGGGRLDDRRRAELVSVRAERVAFDRAESFPGLSCIGSPIDYPLPAPAAVSVCGPVGEVLTDRRTMLAVQQAAGDIADVARRLDPTLRLV